MSEFSFAKSTLKILVVIGFLIIIVGGIIFMSQIERGLGVAITAGIVAIVPGVIVVAVSQMGLAQIVTAESTREMLNILRSGGGNGLMQAASGRTASDVSGSSASAPAPGQQQPKHPKRIKVYKGYELIKVAEGVEVDGQVFENVLRAEQWVNEAARPQS